MSRSILINLASDNYSVVHDAVMQALVASNVAAAPAYGNDADTKETEALFQQHFSSTCQVYFVVNGTGANVTALSSVVRAHHAIICADNAHIHVDECGAAEKFLGCKLLTVPTVHGKLSIDAIERHMNDFGNTHRNQPKVLALSQATELGTVYTVEEVRQLADYAHRHGMYLFMDGARLSNAACAVGCSLKEMTVDVGVDLLTFGGTKNGMMYGEAVVFFNPALSKEFCYIRKQSMQLVSKLRFISVQFQALLTEGLWQKNAQHANAMACRLAAALKDIPGIFFSHPIETNCLFVTLPANVIAKLQEEFYFYIWNKNKGEVRLMTSFDTRPDEVEAFASRAAQLLSSASV